MGCCGSSASVKITPISTNDFLITNAPSIDAFFASVKRFSDKWEAGIGPMMEAKTKFMELSKFKLEPNQKIGISIIGMLLYFSTGLSGEEKINFELTASEPFFEIKPPGKISDG